MWVSVLTTPCLCSRGCFLSKFKFWSVLVSFLSTLVQLMPSLLITVIVSRKTRHYSIFCHVFDLDFLLHYPFCQPYNVIIHHVQVWRWYLKLATCSLPISGSIPINLSPTPRDMTSDGGRLQQQMKAFSRPKCQISYLELEGYSVWNVIQKPEYMSVHTGRVWCLQLFCDIWRVPMIILVPFILTTSIDTVLSWFTYLTLFKWHPFSRAMYMLFYTSSFCSSLLQWNF